MLRITCLLSVAAAASGFVVPTTTTASPSLRMSSSEESVKNNEKYLEELSKQKPNLGVVPGMNPDRPELPEIPGDFDWDAKYAGDDDWVSDPAQIPGKAVLSRDELIQQAEALGQLEEKWRGQRDQEMYEDSINVGWVPNAELANGRFAMFFLVTGLLTEFWTGVSMPGQVEELLRVGGFIGFD